MSLEGYLNENGDAIEHDADMPLDENEQNADEHEVLEEAVGNGNSDDTVDAAENGITEETTEEVTSAERVDVKNGDSVGKYSKQRVLCFASKLLELELRC